MGELSDICGKKLRGKGSTKLKTLLKASHQVFFYRTNAENTSGFHLARYAIYFNLVQNALNVISVPASQVCVERFSESH